MLCMPAGRWIAKITGIVGNGRWGWADCIRRPAETPEY